MAKPLWMRLNIFDSHMHGPHNKHSDTMTRTPKIIVHAGFHKTGTKSVQLALEENASLLAPYLRCFLRSDVRKLIPHARQFSQSRAATDLKSFGKHCHLFFEGMDQSDPRPIVISAEDLSGLMPGRGGVKTYGAVPDLMAEIERVVASVFEGMIELDILLSTRQRDSWLASLWWQNLRSRRIDLDLKAHSALFSEAADLQSIVTQTQQALSFGKVHSAALEDSKSAPEGPATVVFDLAGLNPETRSLLAIGGVQNARPKNGIEDVFLALNRSSFSDGTVSATKKALLRAARQQEA